MKDEPALSEDPYNTAQWVALLKSDSVITSTSTSENYRWYIVKLTLSFIYYWVKWAKYKNSLNDNLGKSIVSEFNFLDQASIGIYRDFGNFLATLCIVLKAKKAKTLNRWKCCKKRRREAWRLRSNCLPDKQADLQTFPWKFLSRRHERSRLTPNIHRRVADRKSARARDRTI